jgi:hypothetical protein
MGEVHATDVPRPTGSPDAEIQNKRYPPITVTALDTVRDDLGPSELEARYQELREVEAELPAVRERIDASIRELGRRLKKHRARVASGHMAKGERCQEHFERLIADVFDAKSDDVVVTP